MAARATPASSSAAVSRPTMCDTAARPAAMPSLSSAAATSRDVLVQAALRDQGAGEEGHGR